MIDVEMAIWLTRLTGLGVMCKALEGGEFGSGGKSVGDVLGHERCYILTFPR